MSMRRMSLLHLLWGAAVLSACAGALAGLLTLRALGEVAGRLTARRKQLTALGDLRRQLQPFLQAQDVAARESDRSPVALGDLLKAQFPAAKAEDLRDLGGESPPGWVIHRREVALGDAPQDKVLALVQSAEAQRPPWRLVRYAVRAGNR